MGTKIEIKFDNNRSNECIVIEGRTFCKLNVLSI